MSNGQPVLESNPSRAAFVAFKSVMADALKLSRVEQSDGLALPVETALAGKKARRLAEPTLAALTSSIQR